MKKFCVFCGKKPKKKNMEHVIPQWLIKLTGDPKREIILGKQLNKEGKPLRKFPFKEFKLPACTICNEEHGKLESSAQHITLKILNNEQTTRQEISTFLDWLDKVRVGLWLAFHYLDENIYDINPNFHIESRIASDDRLLFIYKATSKEEGVAFIGTNTPAFQYSPSCFTLRINNYFFFNASFQFFIARRLGFPFPEKMSLHSKGLYAMNLMEARQRIMQPIIQWPYLNECIEIYQPIFANNGVNVQAKELFENEYVTNNSLNHEQGKGNPFLKNGRSIVTFPQETKDQWLQMPEFDSTVLTNKVSRQTLDFQNRLIDIPSLEGLEKEAKIYAKRETREIKSLNKSLIKDLIKAID